MTSEYGIATAFASILASVLPNDLHILSITIMCVAFLLNRDFIY